MIIEEPSLRYIANVLAFVDDPDLLEQPEPVRVKKLFRNLAMVESIVSQFPEDITQDDLHEDAPLLRQAARIYLYQSLSFSIDMTSLPAGEIDRIMDENTEELATVLLMQARLILELLPKGQMMAELQDWQHQDFEKEVAEWLAES